MATGEKCCSVPHTKIFSAPAWVCPPNTGCCSPITTKQCKKKEGKESPLEALAQCCNASEVCCPSSESTVGTNSAQVDDCDDR
jgi:hypothetical protein